MIPRIQTGSSFKGAGLYYLHDKRQEGELVRLTDARVAWTHALNTLEEEPEAVLAEMRQTAFDQPYLKMMSGNRIDGRPTEKPVMTVVLAWSPTESPSRDDKIAAAQSFLEHMGWQEHQCLIVAHQDTNHPHIHLILNRVHPETGMGIDDSWRNHRAHEWSLAYERERGQVLCAKRLETEARAKGETLRPKEKAAHAQHYGDWRGAQQELGKEGVFEAPELRQAAEWSALKADQRAEREAFWKDTGRLRYEVRRAVAADVREEFAPDWQAYAERRDELAQQAKLYDSEARRATRHLMRSSGAKAGAIELKEGSDGKPYRQRRGAEPAGVRQIKDRQKDFHTRLAGELKEMRDTIRKEQGARNAELEGHALAKLGEDRKELYDALLARQREGKGQLHADQRSGRARFDLLGRYYRQTASQDRPRGARETPRENEKPSSGPEQMQRRLTANAAAVKALNGQALAPRDVSAYVAHARGQSPTRENFAATARETTMTETARAEQARRDAADCRWREERRGAPNPLSKADFTEARQRATRQIAQERSRDSSRIERLDGREGERERSMSRDRRDR